MTAKRQATTELNHDNWNEEEEPEERGTFKCADPEVLEKRVIAKSRRRLPVSSSTDAGKSIFGGFQGFGTASGSNNSTTTASPSPFAFLAKVSNTASNIVSSSSGSTSGTCTTTVNTATFITTATSTSGVKNSGDVPVGNTNNTGNASEYYAKLSCLNKDLNAWIKYCVEKNSLCDLTPVFKDYTNHLADIQKLKPIEKDTKADANTLKSEFKAPITTEAGIFSASYIKASGSKVGIFGAVPKSATNDAKKTNGFGANLQKDEISSASKPSTDLSSKTKKDEITNIFTFNSQNNGAAVAFGFGGEKGGDKDTQQSSPKPFSFGLKANDTQTGTGLSEKPKTSFSFRNTTDGATTSGFTFKPSDSAMFSWTNIKPPAAASTSDAPSSNDVKGEDDEDDNDEAHKFEFKEVVEEDAVYSKKCKAYVKKESAFVDRGVGTLYLKPVKETGKTQLLMRADTNLGNILLNLILNEAIPSQRAGKNNVMLVCNPTPDCEKPTTVLLRVKTSEDADELLEKIETYKKS